MTRTRTSALAAALLAAALLAAGCGSDSGSDTSNTGDGSATTAAAGTGDGHDHDGHGDLSGSITVSAAASLTESFDTLRDQFIAEHPGVTITINYGASGQLATQITEGAPADVAAFADTAPMDKLVEADLVDDSGDGAPATFATNNLVIVTKPGNPEKISSLANLVDAGIISLCGESAPCGVFADRIFELVGFTVPESSVTRGQDVKATLAAVSEGDAVAGLVYRTDAKAAGDRVTSVEFPESDDVTAEYPIAVVSATSNPSLAGAFVDYLRSSEGTAVLSKAGFGAP